MDQFRLSRCGIESSIETSWRLIEIPPTSYTALLPSLPHSPLACRAGLLCSPPLAHSGCGAAPAGTGGASARACQGQLTSVTFSAIHWLFADSGGAMMDCPARAAAATDGEAAEAEGAGTRRISRGGGRRQRHLRGMSCTKTRLKIIAT